MSFTVTQPLGRPPTFAELQALAKQHDVQINVRVKGLRPHAAGRVKDLQPHVADNGVGELTGDFCHPHPEQPKVKGNYTFEPNGDIRGDFTAHVMGTLTGTFLLTTGKAEVTVTEKPFLLPEAVLKIKISEALKDFCAKFST